MERGQRQKIAFDAVLGVLQGWLGERVTVSVDSTKGPMFLVICHGELRAGIGQFTPGWEDSWGWRAGESEFSLDRDYFDEASFDGRTLEATLGGVIVRVEV
jgi:hypothetical protein